MQHALPLPSEEIQQQVAEAEQCATHMHVPAVKLRTGQPCYLVLFQVCLLAVAEAIVDSCDYSRHS